MVVSIHRTLSQPAFKLQLKTFLFSDTFNVVYDRLWLFLISYSYVLCTYTIMHPRSFIV